MKKLILSLLIIPALVFSALTTASLNTSPAYAANALTEEACKSGDAQQKAALGCEQEAQAPSVIQNLLNAVIALVGIIAVGMIVVAGQRYITSNGDPGQVQQAKNMILYSIVGIIVAVLSFAIVNFVLSGVFSPQS